MNPDFQNTKGSDGAWLSMAEAASLTPYSAEYLSLLARKKKLAAKKIGKTWYTTKAILDEYMRRQMIRNQIQHGDLSSLGPQAPAVPAPVPDVADVPAAVAPDMVLYSKRPIPAAPAALAFDAVASADHPNTRRVRTFHSDLRGYLDRLNDTDKASTPTPVSKSQAKPAIPEMFKNVAAFVPKVAPAESRPVASVVAPKALEPKIVAVAPVVPAAPIVAPAPLGLEAVASTLSEISKKLDRVNVLPGRPNIVVRSWQTIFGSKPLIYATIVVIFFFSIFPTPFVFGFFDNAFAAAKQAWTDANTVMGFRPGTHQNEILLLDKQGNISIMGHIETDGQFRSYAKDGVAPIVVDSKTLVKNLNADMLDGNKAGDFTLAFVTKNGNVTTDDVYFNGNVQVGKTLLVKGATKLLSAVEVDGGLSVFGDARFAKSLTVDGPTFLNAVVNTTDNVSIGKNLHVRGSIDAGRSVIADNASFNSLGVVGDFSAGGEIALGDPSETITIDSKNASLDEDGNFVASTGHFISGVINNLTSAVATIATLTAQSIGVDALTATDTTSTNLVAINATTTNATTTNLVVSGSLNLSAVASCMGGSQALQTDAQGNVNCGMIAGGGGSSSGGGWFANGLGAVLLSTTTDRVAIGATTSPYAKLSIVSGSSATTTLALIPASGQTANIIDIYNGSGALSSVLSATGNLGLGTTSPFARLSVVGNTYIGGDIRVSGGGTTTSFAITSIAGSVLKTDTQGNVVPAIAGVDYALPGGGSWSTTSSDYYKSVNNFFSTTSAAYWDSTIARWSTTSTDYYKSVNNFFSTTSSDYYASQFRDWSVLGGALRPTTTIGILVNASSTINGNFVVTGNSTTTNATTTNLALSSIANSLLKTNGSGSVLAAIAGTDYATVAQLWATTSSDYWESTKARWSTTSSDYYKSVNNFFSTSSQNYFASQFRDFAISGGYLTPTTTQTILANGGFVSQASSTVAGDFTITGNATATQATTTNLAISSIANSLLKTNGSGSIIAAVAGTDYATVAQLWSTTSTDYWKSVNNFWSTTSAAYWDSTISRWSTTSSDYYKSVNNFFSTTSESYYQSQFRDWNIVGGALRPTTTVGILVSASSTIGSGAQIGGLTINGGATTTGSAYFAGNVGIGTAAPVQALDVNGSIVVGTLGQVQWRGSGGNISSIRTIGTSDLTFRINGSDRMILDASGNLGVGTTSPFTRLSIAGDAYIGGNLTATGTATTTNLSILGITNSLLKTNSLGQVVAAIPGSDFWATSSQNYYSSQFRDWSINSFGALAPTTTRGIFVTASSTIGDATQTGGLTINGGATTTGSAYFAGNVGVSTSSPVSRFTVQGDVTSNGGSLVTIDKGAGSTIGLLLRNTLNNQNSGGHLFQIVGGAGVPSDTSRLVDISLNNGATSAFVIGASTGNVGIGTTTPQNILAAVGTIQATTALTVDAMTAGSANASLFLNGYLSGVKKQAQIFANFNGGLVMLPNATDPTVTIGATSPANGNTLGVSGKAAIGSTFIATAAPTNGLIVQGSVGLGTSSPTVTGIPLTTDSGSSNYDIIVNSTSARGAGIAFRTNGVDKGFIGSEGKWIPSSSPANMALAAGSGFGLSFFVNGVTTPSAVLTTGGNFGIGTTSPEAKLTVTGAANVSGKITSYATSEAFTAINGGLNAVTARFGNSNNDFYVGTEGNTGGAFFTGALANSSVLYSTRAVQTIIGGVPRTIVDTAGNVGIGTTSPFARLSIAGGAYIGGDVTATGTATTTNLSILGITNALLKTNSLGQVVAATPGTDFWATSSQNYYSSQFRDWSVNSFGALAPTTTRGIFVTASSTIGNGASGLTVNGGATTTGSAYFAANETLDGKLLVNGSGTAYDNGYIRLVSSPTDHTDIWQGDPGVGFTGILFNVLSSNTGRVSFDFNNNYTSYFNTNGWAITNAGTALDQISINRTTNTLRIAEGFNHPRAILGTRNDIPGPGYLDLYDSLNTGTPYLSLNATTSSYINGGNLGIGTTSPLAKLSVAGDAYIGGNLTATGTVTFTNLTNGLVKSTNGVLSNAVAGTDFWATSSQNYYSSQFRDWNIVANSLRPTTTLGILVSASSTIGDATQTGGLTINGGATTTGNAYFAGNVGIGSSSPSDKLVVTTGTKNGGITVQDTPGNAGSGGGITFAATLGAFNNLGKIYTFLTNGGPGTVAGDLRFQTANGAALADRMTITGAGNVGIGTTTPSGVLTVRTNSSSPVIYLDNNLSGGRPWSIDPYITGVNNAGFQVRDQLAGASRLVIDTNGNVGIGTTSPTTKLVLGANNVGSGSVLTFTDLPQSYNDIIKVQTFGSLAGWKIRSAGGAQELFDLTDGSNNSRFFVNTTTGLVGIGTSSPVNARLYVASATTTSAELLRLDATSAQGRPYLGFSSQDVKRGAIGYLNTNSDRLSIMNNQQDLLLLGTNGVARMAIDGNGLVGIGTLSPSATLEVSAATTDATVLKEVARLTRTGGTNIGGSTGRAAILTFADSNNPTLTSAVGGYRDDPNNNYNGGLSFYTNNTGGTNAANVTDLTERMRITSGGNVGIGTSTPFTKLSVQGNGYLSGDLTAANITATGTISSVGTLFGSSAVSQSFYTGSYTVPTATNVNINLRSGVSTLVDGWNYRIQLAVPFTGTNTGAEYIVYQTAAGTWTAKLVSANGTTSNHPLLGVSGSNVYVFHNHAATYTINTVVEGFYTGNTSLTAPTFFGLDGALTNLAGNIGIGTTSPSAALSVNGPTYTNDRLGLGVNPATSGDSSIFQVYGNTGAAFATFKQTDSNQSSIAIKPGNGSNNSHITSNYGTGNGYLGLGAGGDDQVVVTNAGNVGIGTTTPLNKFSVNGAGMFYGSNLSVDPFQDSAGLRVGFYAPGDYGYINAVQSGVAAKKLTINPNGGAVGIGTTTPVARLDVFGGSTAIESGTNFDTLRLGTQSAGNGSLIESLNAARTNYAPFQFFGSALTYTNGGASRPDFTITSAGNVGIGTTTAGEKLTIEGAMGGAATNTGALSLFNTSANSLNTGVSVQMFAKDDNGARREMARVGSLLTNGNPTNFSSDLQFMTSNAGSLTEKMRLTAAGNVGIGTTTPFAQLSVFNSTSADASTAISAAYFNRVVDQRYGITVRNSNPNPVAGAPFAGLFAQAYDFTQAGSPTETAFFGLRSKDSSGNQGEALISAPSHIKFYVNRAGIDINSYSNYGTVALTIATSTNIGIGTTSPIAKLQVQGGDILLDNNRSLSFYYTGGTAQPVVRLSSANVEMFGDFSNSFQTQLGGNFLSFQTGGAIERMRIDPSGNIGVATTTPWGKFAIGTVNQPISTPSFVIASSSTGVATTTQFVVMNGVVGIGTASPVAASRLNINGTGGNSTFIQFSANNDLASLRIIGRQGFHFPGLAYGTEATNPVPYGYGFDYSGNPLIGNLTGTPTAALYVNASNGNVGIGTTTPQDKLHVGNGGVIRLSTSGDTTSGCFRQSGTTLQYSNDCVSYQGFSASTGGGWTDDGTVVRLTTSTDNIGAGTTTTSAKITVTDNSDHQIDVYGADGSTSGAGIDLISRSVGGRDFLLYSTGSGSCPGAGYFGIYDRTSGAGCNGGYRFTIGPTGNVGIGTTSPMGNLSITNASAGTASVYIGDFNNSIAKSNALKIDTAGGNNTARVEFYEAGSPLGIATPNAAIGVRTSQGAQLIMETSGSERMRIDSTGNIGVGTTSPRSKLEVNSSSGGSKLILGSSDTNANDETLEFRSSFGPLLNSSDILSNISGAPDQTSGGRIVFRTATIASGVLTERMRIDSGGAVMIGTTSPTGTLNNPLTLQVTAVGDGLGIIGNTSGALSPAVSLYDVKTQRGAFGLSLFATHYSSISVPNDVVLRASGSASGGSLILTTQNATGNIEFSTGSGGNDNLKAIITNGGSFGLGTSSPWGKFAIGTANQAINVPSFVIASSSTGVATTTQFVVMNGNVGIGTTTPTSKLDMYGSVDGAVTGGITNASAGTGAYAQFQIMNNASTIAGFQLLGSNFSNAGLANRAVFYSSKGASVLTNNTISSGGIDTFAITTGGFSNNPTLTVTGGNPGNVGIGTTSPSAKLTIANNIATGFLDNYSEYQVMIFDSLSAATSYGIGVKSNNMVFNSGAGGFSFDRAGGATEMTIDTSGNVGVGTTSPAATFAVNGNAFVSGSVTSSNINTTGAGSSITVNSGRFGDNSSIYFQQNAGTTYDARIGTTIQGAGNGGFAVAMGGNALTNPAFYINQSGNVGIGTTSPSSKLTVTGAGCFSGGAGSTQVCGNTGGNIYYRVANTGTYDVAENYRTSDLSVEAGDIVAVDTANSGSMLIVKASDSKHVLGVVSTDPGLVLGGADAAMFGASTTRPVALSGRVPVKVNGENGSIVPGDKIALSSIPGIGRKAKGSEETFGIALESWSGGPLDQGLVTIFVSNKQSIDQSQFLVDDLGNVGIGTTTNPTYKLQVMGDIAATSFVNISTRDAKKGIAYLDDTAKTSMLAELRTLGVATYRYNQESDSAPLRLGLIAEEAPSEVLAAGGKGVDVYKLSTFILAGVQEMANKLDDIDTRVNANTQNIAQLQSDLASANASIKDLADRIASATTGTTTQSITWSSDLGAQVTAFLETAGLKLQNGIAYIANAVVDSFSANIAYIKNATIDSASVGALSVGSAEKRSGITLYDQLTGDPYCLEIAGGQTRTQPGECPTITATSTAPVQSPEPGVSGSLVIPGNDQNSGSTGNGTGAVEPQAIQPSSVNEGTTTVSTPPMTATTTDDGASGDSSTGVNSEAATSTDSGTLTPSTDGGSNPSVEPLAVDTASSTTP